MHRRSLHVLIADDEEDDRFLIQRCFQKALKPSGTVHAVDSGEDAINYIRGHGDYQDRKRFPFPTLLMIDLNMPKVDGLGVLEFMLTNPAWNAIPRIIFSSSIDADDVKKAYLVGASIYHEKPPTRDGLDELIELIVTYWRRGEMPEMDKEGRLLPTRSAGKIGERIAESQAGHKARQVRP